MMAGQHSHCEFIKSGLLAPLLSEKAGVINAQMQKQRSALLLINVQPLLVTRIQFGGFFFLNSVSVIGFQEKINKLRFEHKHMSELSRLRTPGQICQTEFHYASVFIVLEYCLLPLPVE